MFSTLAVRETWIQQTKAMHVDLEFSDNVHDGWEKQRMLRSTPLCLFLLFVI
jgi:hypothetical protein